MRGNTEDEALAEAYGLALQLFEAGALAAAEEACGLLLQAAPALAEALLLQGVCRWQRGANELALQSYDRALAIRDGWAEARFNRGLVLRALGRDEEALHSYRAVLFQRPDWAEAHFNLGNLLLDRQQPTEAAASYRRALALQPGYAAAHHNLGHALGQIGQTEDALAAYTAAMAADAADVEACYSQGELLLTLGRPADAEAVFLAGLGRRQDHGPCRNGLGLAYMQLGQIEAALACFDALIQQQPGDAKAHNNRGVALQALGRWDEAEQSYDAAIVRNAAYAEAYCNRGQLRQQSLDLSAALDDYRQAQQLAPDYAEAHWNEALCLLLQGELTAGWDKYEWRWRLRETSPPPINEATLWDGTPLAGRTLLLWAEQGFGDTLNFLRYATLLATTGERLLLEVPPGLVPLLVDQLVGVTVIARGSARPAFDVHCPLLSLPRLLGTTLATIPSAVPYLNAPMLRRQSWHQRLGPRRGYRIGLVWSGSPTHRGDLQRSIPLVELAPLWQVPGVEWISLQVEIRDSDRATLAVSPLTDFAGAISDFADTAALLAELDLVIAVDTAVAHLAGAMGLPLWLLLPHFPDWRWLLDRDDTLWYRSAHLFRQSQRGDWETVIKKVSSELRQLGTRK